MNKLISYSKDAMNKIKGGIDLVVDPVKSTLSPLGRTVIISEAIVGDYKINDYPLVVSKDGYRVGMAIYASDREVNVGVLFAQQVLVKQMIDAGDATTTAALLTQAILNGGLKLIDAGHTHIEVKKGILKATDIIVKSLKKMSTPINGNADLIRQVATVSANGDEEIGNLIGNAFSQIGEDGVIDIEQSKSPETKISISPGLKFHKGYASQYFVTDKSKAECVLENPYILIYDRTLSRLMDSEGGAGIMPILEKIIKHQQQTGIKRPLMIFCDSADGEALSTLTFNTQQGVLQSCVVEMQFLGDKKRVFLEDIAAATGGYFVNELKGVKLSNTNLNHLGSAQKIVVTKDETIIIGGNYNDLIFNQLVSEIKELEEKEEDTDAKELLKKRLARLTGKVATLMIGGTTDVEMKERYDRADDAVRATASAVEEGYTAGGGNAFRFAGISLSTYTGSEQKSILDMMCQITKEPLKQICLNSAIDYDKVLQDLLQKESNIGYNAANGKVEDLIKAGIIEPTKSNRCAIENAASVACAILTSNYMITDTM